MDLRAVIIAGGTGTRFWPLSRKKRPKQFLPIVSDKTMIDELKNNETDSMDYSSANIVPLKVFNDALQNIAGTLKIGDQQSFLFLSEKHMMAVIRHLSGTPSGTL